MQNRSQKQCLLLIIKLNFSVSSFLSSYIILLTTMKSLTYTSSLYNEAVLQAFRLRKNDYVFGEIKEAGYEGQIPRTDSPLKWSMYTFKEISRKPDAFLNNNKTPKLKPTRSPRKPEFHRHNSKIHKLVSLSRIIEPSAMVKSSFHLSRILKSQTH